MSKKTLLLWISVGLCAILSVSTLIIVLVSPNRILTANEIYNLGTKNVVELKAEKETVGNSFGTAELIDQEGTLITNAHVVTYKQMDVVHEFENYFVRFMTETEYREVNLVAYDIEQDIAVLKLLDATGLEQSPIKIGNSSNLKAGDKVYAIGNAANYGIGIFEGIISNPLVNVNADGVIKSAIQADITIAAGNSGGALLNAHGELIGITTFRTKDLSGNVIYGIVYSVPINKVMEFISEKVKKGEKL